MELIRGTPGAPASFGVRSVDFSDQVWFDRQFWARAGEPWDALESKLCLCRQQFRLMSTEFGHVASKFGPTSTNFGVVLVLSADGAGPRFDAPRFDNPLDDSLHAVEAPAPDPSRPAAEAEWGPLFYVAAHQTLYWSPVFLQIRPRAPLSMCKWSDMDEHWPNLGCLIWGIRSSRSHLPSNDRPRGALVPVPRPNRHWKGASKNTCPRRFDF